MIFLPKQKGYNRLLLSLKKYPFQGTILLILLNLCWGCSDLSATYEGNFDVQLQAPNVIIFQYEIDPLEAIRLAPGNGENLPSGVDIVKLKLSLPDDSVVTIAQGKTPYLGTYKIENPKVGIYDAYLEITMHAGTENEYVTYWDGNNYVWWGRTDFTGDRVSGIARSDINLSGGMEDIVEIQLSAESGVTVSLAGFSVELPENYFQEPSTLRGEGSFSLVDCSFGDRGGLTVTAHEVEVRNCHFKGGFRVEGSNIVTVFDSDFLLGDEETYTDGVGILADSIQFSGNFTKSIYVSFKATEDITLNGNDFYGIQTRMDYIHDATNVIGNVFATPLEITAPDLENGSEVAFSRNNILGTVSFTPVMNKPPLRNINFPQNYWGSWRGPDPTLDFLPEDLIFQEKGVERVSGSSEIPPESGVRAVLDYGQNIMGNSYLNPYLRRGRDLLVRAFVYIDWGTLNASEFTLKTSGGSFTPRNSKHVIRRDYGKPSSGPKSRSEYLEFIVPAPATGSLTASLVFAHDGETKELSQVQVGFHPGPARKLRIAVVPVEVIGYKKTFIYPKPGNVNAMALKKAIVSMLPLCPDEVDVVALPKVSHAFGYTALLSLLSTSAMMNEVSSAFNSELNRMNSTLSNPYDFLVVCLPNGTMGNGNLGASLSFRRRVILLDEVSPDSAVHEIGHFLGLYTLKEQYTVWDEGYDDSGLYHKDGFGIRLENMTAFVPDAGWSHPNIKGRIRNFPKGIDCNTFDIMGGDGQQFIIPSTHRSMSSGLFDLLGTAIVRDEAPSPRKIASEEFSTGSYPHLKNPITEDEGMRRIVARGFLVHNGSEWRLDTSSVRFSMASEDTGILRQTRFTGYRLKGFDASGLSVFVDDIFSSQNTPISDWIQTFDVPNSVVRYEIHRLASESTSPVYYIYEAMDSMNISLTALETGSDTSVELSWAGSFDSATNRQPTVFLQSTTDGGSTWKNLGVEPTSGRIVVHSEDMDSASLAQFRAVMSDGFSSVYSATTSSGSLGGIDESSGLVILSPWDGAASDPEYFWQLSAEIRPDGEDLSSVLWTSSLDGELGNELNLTIEEPLSIGQHTLTCTLQTTAGAILSKSVEITVYGADEPIPPDLGIDAEALVITADGVEPTYGSINRPQFGLSCTASLVLRNPGRAGMVTCRLFTLSPSNKEAMIAEETFTWGVNDQETVIGSWIPDELGDWTLRAEIEWSGEEPLTDPDPSNNSRSWTFINEAPVARDFNAAVDGGQTVGISLVAYDPDGDPLDFSIIAGPSNGTLSGSGAELSYTANSDFDGSDSFSYSVNDGIHEASTGIVDVRVTPTPPIITSPTTLTGKQYDSLTYKITATGDVLKYGAPYFNLPNQPWTGCSFDESTGLLSGAPVGFGTATLTLFAENAVGRNEVNVAVDISRDSGLPVITSPTTVYGIAGEPFNYTVTYDGVATEAIFEQMPAGLFYNAFSMVISGDPLNSGQYSIPIGVKNSFGTTWMTLNLQVLPTTKPPQIQGYTTLYGAVGTPFDAQLSARYDPRYYHIRNLPVGLILDESTGHITGSPLQSGSLWLSAEVGNLNGISGGDVIFNIQPLEGAPVLSGTDMIGVEYNAPFNYQIVASNNPTNYRAEGLPPGLHVDANTGLISGSSTASGEYSIILYADNAVGSGAQRLALTIYIDFEKPYLLSASSIYMNLGENIDSLIEAANNPFRIELSNLPSGMVYDATTHRITGHSDKPGNYLVTVEAENAKGVSTMDLTLHVLPDYAAWKVANEISDDGADLDADGLPNLLEFLLGCDPRIVDAEEGRRFLNIEGQAWLWLRLPPGGTGNPLLGYTAGGVDFYIESSDNLSSEWGRQLMGLGGGIVESSDEAGWRVFNIPVINPPEGQAYFFRLLGELP